MSTLWAGGKEMSTTLPYNFMNELCEALNLEPENVKSILISIIRNDVTVVKIIQYKPLTMEDAEKVIEVMSTYELVKK